MQKFGIFLRTTPLIKNINICHPGEIALINARLSFSLPSPHKARFALCKFLLTFCPHVMARIRRPVVGGLVLAVVLFP